MTAKRFTVPKNYRCIQDNLTKEHYLCEDKTEAINLAYLLNELVEENEQLQIDKKNWYRNDSKIRVELHKLKKENEHIKQTIKDMINTERTEIGKSVLKQLYEAIQ